MDSIFTTAPPSVLPITDPNNTWRKTNTSLCPYSEAWDWLYTMQPTYMFIICVLGIIGNIFVLVVFCLHKKPCTVAEIYLSNLAVADLILLSCLPFWAINIANEFNWQFGEALCRLVNTGIKINMYGSIYSLVLVSADRYVALVHTMSHGRMRRPFYAKLSCMAVWGLAILLSIPTLTFRHVHHVPEFDVTACLLDYPSLASELTCDLMLILFGFIIPLSVITFCTYRICLALQGQALDRFNAQNTEKKATVLVLVVLLVFLLCWIPFHLVTFLDVLARLEVLTGCVLETGLEICNQFFTYLALSNSVLNPILYVIVGKNFRKKVIELVKQFTLQRRMTSGSTKSQFSSTLKTFASN